MSNSPNPTLEFLGARPQAPVSSFMEIYESGQFHPFNDLFHAIADGPDSVDGDVEYLQRRLNQEHFRRLLLNIFASARVDFIVCPTVRVIPPTREELIAEKYSCLTFPTNTVIGSQTGLPAMTIPVGFTDTGLPVGTGGARRTAERGEAAAVRAGVGAQHATPPGPSPLIARWRASPAKQNRPGQRPVPSTGATSRPAARRC